MYVAELSTVTAKIPSESLNLTYFRQIKRLERNYQDQQ